MRGGKWEREGLERGRSGGRETEERRDEEERGIGHKRIRVKAAHSMLLAALLTLPSAGVQLPVRGLDIKGQPCPNVGKCLSGLPSRTPSLRV